SRQGYERNHEEHKERKEGRGQSEERPFLRRPPSLVFFVSFVVQLLVSWRLADEDRRLARARAMAAASSSGLDGFAGSMNAPSPSTVERLASITPGLAVIISTGSSRVAGRSRSARSAAMPSMRGILTSSSARSGGASRLSATAASPSAASTTR